MVADPGVEPGPPAYETDEVPFFEPATFTVRGGPETATNRVLRKNMNHQRSEELNLSSDLGSRRWGSHWLNTCRHRAT